MTTAATPLIGVSPKVANWDAIEWRAIEQQVQRLQIRIAKATRERRWGKVKALQWLLTHAFSAKLLAVRRVTRNPGRNTAGVDGIVWKTAAQKLRAAGDEQIGRLAGVCLRFPNFITHRGQSLKRLSLALIVALLRTLSVLPYKFVARLGMVVGTALYAFPSRRKHIVLVNLRLCFPEKTSREHQKLARAHFRHVVRSYLERGIQWFGSAQSIRDIVQIESKIDLNDDEAPPTILMGFHFVGIEAGCMLYSTHFPVASLYTRMSNTVLCDLAKRQRGRFGAEMIERATSARKIVGLLRSDKPVMLAADMDQGVDNSVFVPFFGVPACTLTVVSRLARLGRARVVPFVTEVLPNYQGYKLTIFEPLADFPSGSDVVDARRMNAFLEEQVVKFPEQYYWVHRRFKHRPPGMASVY